MAAAEHRAALDALDAEIAAHEARRGYSSRGWKPRGYVGLADSIRLATEHKARFGYAGDR